MTSRDKSLCVSKMEPDPRYWSGYRSEPATEKQIPQQRRLSIYPLHVLPGIHSAFSAPSFEQFSNWPEGGSSSSSCSTAEVNRAPHSFRGGKSWEGGGGRVSCLTLCHDKTLLCCLMQEPWRRTSTVAENSSACERGLHAEVRGFYSGNKRRRSVPLSDSEMLNATVSFIICCVIWMIWCTCFLEKSAFNPDDAGSVRVLECARVFMSLPKLTIFFWKPKIFLELYKDYNKTKMVKPLYQVCEML